MATDVFGRQVDIFGGAFSSDAMKMTFPNVQGFNGAFTGNFGLLVQQIQMNYQQNITRRYEVGRPAVYYIQGPAEGSVSMQRLLGPRALTKAFYQKFGDVCQALSNVLHFELSAGCGTGQTGGSATRARVAFTAHFCVLQGLGIVTNANDRVIDETQQVMFTGLDYDQESR